MSYSSSNAPMLADPDVPVSQGALPLWIKVLTKPGEQTFLQIIDHPEAKAKSAYIWMFIIGTLSGLLSSLINFVAGYAGLQQAFTSEVGSQLPLNPAAVGVGGLLTAICSAPLAGVFSVISFIISTGIVHATARFFGGQGDFDRMAYAFGTVAAPMALISALMIPLNAIPFVVFCTLPLLLGLSIYTLFLQTAAIKAVHKLGWGESVGALLLPTILILLVCGVLFLLAMRAMGPSINDIFQQMQQFQ